MSRRGRRTAFLGSASRGGVARWSNLYGATPSTHNIPITQPVLLDINAVCQGIEITGAGQLVFDPNQSLLLQVDAHPVMVMDGGHLEMAPASAAVTHEIRFINVDETQFTSSGGIDTIDHHLNPGFMVMDATVDLRGTTKTGWTRATGALLAAATSCTVADATGWQIGDEIVITPTRASSVANHFNHFDRRTLTNVVGNTLTFAALTYPHPTNTDPVTGEVIPAEVLNLTRNVKITGQDATHRAHTMFMGDCTGSVLEYFEGRYLGPRQVIPDDPTFTNGVLGRYGLHFHLMEEGSRDINVRGVSMYDLGYRAFVPHGSDGLTFTDCVAWDVFSEGYWWDIEDELLSHESDDLLYDRCFAGRVRRSRPNPEGVHNSGFFLSAGENIAIRNCCVAGVDGYVDTAGYHWPEVLNQNPHNFWIFEDNDAHNIKDHGIFAWQNDSTHHDIVRFRGWNCDAYGFRFGAYFNAYQVDDVKVWGNGSHDLSLNIQCRVDAEPSRLVELYGGGHIGLLRISHHTSSIAIASRPVTFTDVNIDAIEVIESGATPNPGFEDFINCGLHPDDVTVTWMDTDSIIRIQTGASAWRVTSTTNTNKVVESIALFA